MRKFTVTGSDDIEISDGYHTFHELYQHRRALNVALFHAYAEHCIKSRKHFDGTMFEGGYFIVMMTHPIVGQISYHYQLKHWDEFRIPEVELAPKHDGHTPQDTIERLLRLG